MGLIRDAVADYSEAVAISYANVGSAGEGPVINEVSGRRPLVQRMSSVCVETLSGFTSYWIWELSEGNLTPGYLGDFHKRSFFSPFLQGRKLFGKLEGEDYWKTQ